MVQPGQFRHKTTISTITESQQSDYGDFDTYATTTADRFAKVKWLPGAESIEADVISLVKNIEFTYRYESLTKFIDRIDFITYDSEVYYIKSVEFKGAGNQQLVVIKAHTAQN